MAKKEDIDYKELYMKEKELNYRQMIDAAQYIKKIGELQEQVGKLLLKGLN